LQLLCADAVNATFSVLGSQQRLSAVLTLPWRCNEELRCICLPVLLCVAQVLKAIAAMRGIEWSEAAATAAAAAAGPGMQQQQQPAADEQLL
jgi:hypothetical protein